ncbi:hypothetical protein PC9H_006026 [Pleurotus ostreatus]|uniref:Uncharacterized protein n=1 Tax=Pleurotus ostreatus TaxID=5322 RepID=A0A8H7DSH5_PLEOS|nr:uncharacterized protein PC9H_006026 [Pleurotus ostreatus]KAF7430321.1 hypothetical protein PC9H_006026 [Pleurotus ostreatus]
MTGTCITANGSIIILNVNGPVTGDIFSGPIYGGNLQCRIHAHQAVETTVYVSFDDSSSGLGCKAFFELLGEGGEKRCRRREKTARNESA